ncbi:PREDICTED: translation initiation factor eIF-2B subunit delta-like [Rhagoletis zephyria]|uniref:translation initiation factor eIF-2B subunit delta-like n=1 Tax=Rhagoletis zephyria TaxID=28612 RepID=UPI0008112BBD|nr:PREDICTED: translation initiation factor eIF-2B subunit delta-like [Rhagoletis zephyria]
MASKENTETLTKEQKAALKAQRKAEFEAKFQKSSLKPAANEAKSKAELKAERRAIQEAQRSAKAQTQPLATKQQQTNDQPKSATVAPPKTTSQSATAATPATKTESTPPPDSKANESVSTEKTIIAHKELPDKIFSHLPRRVLDLAELSTSSVPSIVIQVGYRINKDLIRGSTAKCIAMLMAFKTVVEAYKPIEKNDLKRDLQKILFTDCIRFLSKCRPLSISMHNAVKHLKLVFSRIPAESKDDHVKSFICNAIETFVEEEIICSWKAIVDRSLEKIHDEDTILTLGCSTIVKHVSKVIFEAHSLLGNGYVMSHIGSSQVALVAKAYNVPVIVCCETYKFSEKVHTDCFVHNELGNTKSFFSSLGKQNTIDSSEIPENMNVLDLLYDLTPHEFISAVITEKGSLPCTSVPTILRVRETK